MITTILVALAIAQIPKPQFSEINSSIVNADYVGVVRYLGPAGFYESLWGTSEELPNVVFRHRFEKVLDIQGHCPPTLTCLRDTDRGGSDPGVNNVAVGGMALVHLYKPNSERKICGAQGEWYLTTESRDQYYLGGYDNPVTLASGNYALKGSSTLEKYAYILATSFSRNKDLNAMSMISGTGPSGYGDMKPVRDRFEQFYRSEIQPLLDGAIGSDLRLKAYVLASHYLVLRQDYLATLKDLVHRLDREWPNEDDDETFAMGVGDKEFFLSLLDARMPSLREAAIACLPMEFLYQDRIIRKLSDTSKKVRKAAIVWLWQLSLNKNIQPPAPVPDWDEHEGCKNEDAIREYWGGQLIAGAAQASQR